MKFVPLPVHGAFVVEPEGHADERGLFARTFCAETFAAHGLEPGIVQCSTSYNPKRGTLRGMHYQRAPHGEAKLVRCTAGAIHDVLVDLRPESPSFRRWAAVDLDAGNRLAVYAPPGVAHGFLTRADDSEVFYQMSAAQHPGAAAGVRWNDPAFAIQWPGEVVVISARDASLPDFIP